MIESARALYIHPNTLRQRLARIEELTGLALDQDDLLSLELAIKLARLHGRPSERQARRQIRRVRAAVGSVFLDNQEHRDLRLAADPLGLLRPT